MVNGIDNFVESRSFEKSMFVAPKIVREGVDSYLVWLPWCPRSLRQLQFPTPVYKAVDSKGVDFLLLYVWLMAKEKDT